LIDPTDAATLDAVPSPSRTRPRVAHAALALGVALTPVACSRPNSAWIDTAGTGGATSSTGAEATSGASLDTSTGSTTIEATTSGSTTTEPTTSDGTSPTGGPLCPDFEADKIQIDLPLDPIKCAQGVDGFGKVTYVGGLPFVNICTAAACGSCTGIFLPLDPMNNWLADGTCLTGRHEGAWLPGDPEAPTGCKTTGFLLYDEDPIHPLYIASSRVFAHPSTIEPSLAFTVEPVNFEVCECPPDACCVDDQATRFGIVLGKEGATVTVELGSIPLFVLDDKIYAVQLLRGYARGYEAGGACQGETTFVDWQMVRLSP